MLNTLRTGRPLKLGAPYEILEEPHTLHLVTNIVRQLPMICIKIGPYFLKFLGISGRFTLNLGISPALITPNEPALGLLECAPN